MSLIPMVAAPLDQPPVSGSLVVAAAPTNAGSVAQAMTDYVHVVAPSGASAASTHGSSSGLHPLAPRSPSAPPHGPSGPPTSFGSPPASGVGTVAVVVVALMLLFCIYPPNGTARVRIPTTRPSGHTRLLSLERPG